MWMTSCTGSVRGGLWGIWKKSVELSVAARRRRVTFASSEWPCGVCYTCWEGADGKTSIERLCLSPYVEKPLKSKVIKSFVPELRNRKCFSCFGIPMFYVYICYENSMYVSHIRIVGMVHFADTADHWEKIRERKSYGTWRWRTYQL